MCRRPRSPKQALSRVLPGAQPVRSRLRPGAGMNLDGGASSWVVCAGLPSWAFAQQCPDRSGGLIWILETRDGLDCARVTVGPAPGLFHEVIPSNK